MNKTMDWLPQTNHHMAYSENEYSLSVTSLCVYGIEEVAHAHSKTCYTVYDLLVCK